MHPNVRGTAVTVIRTRSFEAKNWYKMERIKLTTKFQLSALIKKSWITWKWGWRWIMCSFCHVTVIQKLGLTSIVNEQKSLLWWAVLCRKRLISVSSCKCIVSKTGFLSKDLAVVAVFNCFSFTRRSAYAEKWQNCTFFGQV